MQLAVKGNLILAYHEDDQDISSSYEGYDLVFVEDDTFKAREVNAGDKLDVFSDDDIERGLVLERLVKNRKIEEMAKVNKAIAELQKEGSLKEGFKW